jgi:TP901 family phage tail tape measure protein
MAGRYVDIIFRAVDQVSGTLGKVTNSLRESNRQWTRAGQQIQRTGRRIQNMGASMTRSVTVPIVGAGAVAVKKFAEVDKTMSLVNETMKNSPKNANMLNEAMKSAAANSVFGMNDAATASLNFARGGWNAAQAAKALAPAMNLAAGEGGNLDTVSAGLMATMNSFDAEANEAAGYANVFAQACNNSALDVDSLSNAMSIAAPIFKSSGGTLEDATLAMGTMANAGIDANVAATSLKTGIARLASPTDSAAAAMNKLGIDAFDSSGKLKDMTQIQKELHDSFKNLTGVEKEEAAAKIFGKNQMAPWLALIEASPKEVDKLSNSLDRNKNTTNKMADAMMSGFGGSIEKLKSSFDVFATTMGGSIAKVATPWIGKLQQLMDAFNNMDEKQRDTIVKIGLMAAAIGPALLVFGKLVTGVGGAVKMVGTFGRLLVKLPGIISTVTTAFAGVSSIGGVFSALGTSIMAVLGPVGAVVAGLAAAVAVGVVVYKNWDKIRSMGEKAFKKLTPVINIFKRTMLSMRQTLVNCWQTIKDSIVKSVTPIVSRIKSIMRHFAQLANTPAFKKFSSILQSQFIAQIKTAMSIAEAVFTVSFAVITNVVSVAIELIGGHIEACLKIFDGLIQFITGVFSGNWKQAWDGVKKIFSGVFSELNNIAKGAMNGVIGIINGAISGINKISVSIPDWVPVMGGKTFGPLSIPTIPQLYRGTNNWPGGLAMVHDRGGEIIDLPRGSRVYPHDESVRRAYNDGSRNVNIKIPKLAETIVIREDADIDRLASAMVHKMEIAMADYAGA